MDDNNIKAAVSTETDVSSEQSTAVMKKPKHKFTDNFVFYMIGAYLLILGGQFLGSLLVEVPIMVPKILNALSSGRSMADIMVNGVDVSPLLATVSSYLLFIGIWIICLLWFLKRNNRPLFRTLGTAEKGNTVQMLLLGLLIGAGMNGLCILSAYLHGDIYMYYDSFRPLPLLLIFISVFIQSSAEELVCRCFLYRKLLDRHGPVFAILGSSLFFSLLHLGNPGVGFTALADIFVSGLLFALMVYYFDSLWCAFAAHTAWNFTQNIIFGLPNSGMVVPFSIMKLDASTASDSFFYNVGFGVEGTVFAVIVEVAVCVLIFMWGKRRASKQSAV